MLEAYLKTLPIENAKEKIEQFKKFKNYLIEQNKLFNLTAITDEKEIEIKHFIDSLAAYPFIDGSVLDIGSGAGFPSIPLKIVFPQNHFTLVDSLSKRVEFLKRVFDLLHLHDCEAVHTRIEDFQKKASFQTVVARAVARMNTLCEYALPFLKTGGLFIAYKTYGSALDEELKEAQKALSILGGKLENVIHVKNEYTEELNHALVLVRKTEDTPPKYPRGQNKPKNNPIS